MPVGDPRDRPFFNHLLPPSATLAFLFGLCNGPPHLLVPFTLLPLPATIPVKGLKPYGELGLAKWFRLLGFVSAPVAAPLLFGSSSPASNSCETQLNLFRWFNASDPPVCRIISCCPHMAMTTSPYADVLVEESLRVQHTTCILF